LLGYSAADTVIRIVEVRSHFGTIEHRRELGFIGMQSLHQTIQRHEVGAAQDAVEASVKLPVTAGRGIQAVCFQIGIEVLCQRTDALLRDALIVVDNIGRLDEARDVGSTHCVQADSRLIGVLDHHRGSVPELVLINTASERALVDDLHLVRHDSR
jgi:hypothetical protein